MLLFIQHVTSDTRYLILDSWYLIPYKTWYLIPHTCYTWHLTLNIWYLIFDTRYLMHDSWYWLSDTGYLMVNIWYSIYDTRYLLHLFWYSISDTSHLILDIWHLDTCSQKLWYRLTCYLILLYDTCYVKLAITCKNIVYFRSCSATRSC